VQSGAQWGERGKIRREKTDLNKNKKGRKGRVPTGGKNG